MACPLPRRVACPAGSIAQLTANYGDGLVIESTTTPSGERGLAVHYVEEVPLAYFNQEFCKSRHCFFWNFCFTSRTQYQTLQASLSHGTGFAPVVLYFHPDDKVASATGGTSRPREGLDLGESITTTWEGVGYKRALDAFFQRHLEAVLREQVGAAATAADNIAASSSSSTSSYGSKGSNGGNGIARNLTVLVWAVNDLPHSASIVGPGTDDRSNAVEAATIAGSSTVVAGIDDASPSLLFQSNVPQGQHTKLLETYDGS
jgi:hypothetical protein